VRAVLLVAGRAEEPTMSTDGAAKMLGTTAELLRRERGTGRLPVEPLTLGSRLRWPTALLAAAVGLPVEIVFPDADGDAP